MKLLLLAALSIASICDTSIQDKVRKSKPRPGDTYYEHVYEMIIDGNVTYIRIHKNDTLIKVGKDKWINIKKCDIMTMK